MAKNLSPIFSKTDCEAGTQANVYPHADGFSVSLKDLDSGEILPYITIFPTLARAVENAMSLVAA
jgi:hypothetical protein